MLQWLRRFRWYRRRFPIVWKVPNGTVLRFNGETGLHNGPLIIEVDHDR